MENTSKSNMQSARLLPFDPIVLVQDVLKRWLVIVLAAAGIALVARSGATSRRAATAPTPKKEPCARAVSTRAAASVS